MKTINIIFTTLILFGMAQSFAFADNPIVTHMYTADPTGKVFDGRMYVYASHDTDTQTGYKMEDYHVYSSSDMVNWQDHGVALAAKDMPWVKSLFAPDCVYRNGLYYLYFPNGGESIGVAISKTPYGPFKDALGKPLIDRQTRGGESVEWVFDPSVFIDDDGQAYMYYGGSGPGHARVIKLKDNMVEVEGEALVVPAPEFFEASFVHKRNGKYYFSYSTNKRPFRIDYLMSDNPMTGWKHKGVVMKAPPENEGRNHHHSIVEFKDRWYMFYHDRRLTHIHGATHFQRSINVDYLYYNYDGTIQVVQPSFDGVHQIGSVNPFTKNESETFDKQGGIEVEETEDGKVYIGSIHNEDWMSIKGVAFDKPTSKVTFSVSGVGVGGTLSIHTQSKIGDQVGRCPIKVSGKKSKWRELTCDVSGLSGKQDIYFVFHGGDGELFQLDWYRFH